MLGLTVLHRHFVNKMPMTLVCALHTSEKRNDKKLNQNRRIQEWTRSNFTAKSPARVSNGKSFPSAAEKSEKYFKELWQETQDKSENEKKLVVRSSGFSGEELQRTIDDYQRSSNQSTRTSSIIHLREADQRHPNERLSENPSQERTDRDPRLSIPLSRYGRIGKTAIYYNKKMSKLGRQGKIREAIYIFDEIMMKKDRVLPSKRTFVILIGILGRVGYTRKAFQVFRQMRMMGYDAEDHIYTGLFNACANCPSKEHGLARAEKLIRYLQENEIKPNIFTVKAMIKTLAQCGDFPRAFAVLDEAATRFPLDTECFNNLLFGCIADKAAGFLRALLVWRAMKDRQIRPDTYTYNLFLRCVRDCGPGDTNKFLQAAQLPGISSKEYLFKSAKVSNNLGFHVQEKDTGFLTSHDNSENVISSLGDKIETNGIESSKYDQSKTKNSLFIEPASVINEEIVTNTAYPETPVSHEKEENNNVSEFSGVGAVSLSKLTLKDLDPIDSFSLQDLKLHPECRLALIGGPLNFICHMMESGGSPDKKTFSQMMACLPNDEPSEVALLNTMEALGVLPDVDILNFVMVRRLERRDHKAVEAALSLMSRLRVPPNMKTYCALARTCDTQDKANQLIKDMETANLEPSSDVMAYLVKASYGNYAYKLHMLKTFEELGHKPNTRILTIIEECILESKLRVIQAEKEGDSENLYLSDRFKIPFRNFLNFYRQWLQRSEINRPEHPWKDYEVTDDMNLRIRDM